MVAHDDSRIPGQPDPRGAAHRRAFAQAGVRRLVELNEVPERRRGPARVRLEACVGLGTRLRPRARVEGADRLAVVATEEAISDALAERLRYRVAVLDREVRDAESRVEDERLHERARRADVDAAGARPAALRDGRVGLELERRDHLAEQDQRTDAGDDDEPVLSNESEPRARGPGPLEHRYVVAHGASLRGLGLTAERPDQPRDLAELLAETVVVVAAARVASDRARERGVGSLLLLRAPVPPRDADHALRAEEDVLAVEGASRLTRGREPGHPALHAVVDERLVAIEIGVEREIRASDPHGIEAEPPRLADDELLGTHAPAPCRSRRAHASPHGGAP